MASSSEKKPCFKCPKGPGQVMCDGCQQYFCLKHLLEHRQQLSQQIDDLTLDHDQLKQNLLLNHDDKQHPLIKRVDRWEAKSIHKIKQIADEVRLQLRESLDHSKKNIGESLYRITDELRESRQTEAFTEVDLAKWMNQLQRVKDQLENPPKINITHDDDEATSTHLPLIQLSTEQQKVSVTISHITKWLTNGETVAGGHGGGDALNQLNCPYDLDIDNDGTMFIADILNHRIMRWKLNASQGDIFVGNKGKGNRTDQLDQPLAVLLDRINDCLIMSEYGNRRVMRWPLDKSKQNVDEGEMIISNIYSLGLALDNEGSLYVSDFEKHEVRRYGTGDENKGVIVAGGNGQGTALNQLNGPRQILIDDDHSVYVSDRDNHRVMKWSKNAREGVVIAGGQARGNSLKQLSYPSGIFVDRSGSVYVADQGNDRVMRWQKGTNQGEVIVGGNGRGSQKNQLNQPTNILFDGLGNLHVADYSNNRIQCFKIQ